VHSLLVPALIALIALKLAGVVTWSWWWVLAPLWINAAPLALLTGVFIALWCWRHLATLVVELRWRRHRQEFFRFEPPSVPPPYQNRAEAGGVGPASP
jgi:hypothetical protein